MFFVMVQFIGYIFQAFNLIQQFNVRDNVSVPLLLSGMRKSEVNKRALANNPDIILADEPTGNLDTKNGETVIGILTEINRTKGTTVLCVSHDERIIAQGGRIINIEEITCVE